MNTVRSSDRYCRVWSRRRSRNKAIEYIPVASLSPKQETRSGIQQTTLTQVCTHYSHIISRYQE